MGTYLADIDSALPNTVPAGNDPQVCSDCSHGVGRYKEAKLDRAIRNLLGMKPEAAWCTEFEGHSTAWGPDQCGCRNVFHDTRTS